MRILEALSFVLLLAFSGCITPGVPGIGVTGQVGYAHMSVGGELALDTTANGSPSSIEQSVDSAFGLGDGRGSPFFRGQVDVGGPVVTASVLWLRESGQGELQDAFGGLAQGTTVDSRMDVALAKISASYDFDIWLLKVSPGVLFDVFALDFSVREPFFGGREEIDDVVFVPMPFVRTEAGLGPVRAVAELGYIDVSSLGDSSGKFLDLEATIEWQILPLAHLFAGYRYIGIDGDGESEQNTFATDLQIQGWMIGGGLRF